VQIGGPRQLVLCQIQKIVHHFPKLKKINISGISTIFRAALFREHLQQDYVLDALDILQ